MYAALVALCLVAAASAEFAPLGRGFGYSPLYTSFGMNFMRPGREEGVKVGPFGAEAGEVEGWNRPQQYGGYGYNRQMPYNRMGQMPYGRRQFGYDNKPMTRLGAPLAQPMTPFAGPLATPLAHQQPYNMGHQGYGYGYGMPGMMQQPFGYGRFGMLF